MMNASIARMGLVILTLASLGGCPACSPKWRKYKPPQLQSVYIFPQLSTMTVAHPKAFKAVALSTAGVTFDPLDYHDEGYKILWEAKGVPGSSSAGPLGAPGPVGVAMVADNKNPVEVMVTDSTLKEFILEVTVSYQGTEVCDSLVIKVIEPALLTAEDRVHVKWTPEIAGVLLNGCELTQLPTGKHRTETRWELFEVSLMTPLGKNYTESGCSREAEFAIAAPFHRLILSDGTSYTQSQSAGGQGPLPTPLWTDTSGDLLNAADPELWLPPDTVDLYVYNYTGNGNVGSGVSPQLKLTNAVYGQSRVGIAFNIVELIEGSPQKLPSSGTICSAEYLKGPVSAGGLDVDIASERLNVVVLQGSLATGAAGWTCPPFDGHPGRVIYLGSGKTGGFVYPETLAHELGHALGHVETSLGFGWDHVGKGTGASYEGFTSSNLMHPRMFGTSRDHLTIGQGFRMNVDTASWYQQEPGILNRHPARGCGLVSACSDACPPIHRDVNEENVSVGHCDPGPSSNGESDR